MLHILLRVPLLLVILSPLVMRWLLDTIGWLRLMVLLFLFLELRTWKWKSLI